ncbi:MAG: lactate utilization protein, partial [Betaproteobacteria bacterium]|nr:lactate utilization protein [Betaproteobacteria bacterium]
MQVQSMHFKARSGQKLADLRLQANLKKLSSKWVAGRQAAIAELDDFEATRDDAVQRRDRGLADLDLWLERFEQEATRRGTVVLWAETPAEASKLVVAIAKQHQVRKVTKSKSMVSEEMALNRALEAAGIQPVETDLGEYILQINNNEPPSHIVAPVLHKDKDEVSDLFAKVHQKPRLSEVNQMTREAREVLRPHFLSSDMGVSGGNFLIAEGGTMRTSSSLSLRGWPSNNRFHTNQRRLSHFFLSCNHCSIKGSDIYVAIRSSCNFNNMPTISAISGRDIF